MTTIHRASTAMTLGAAAILILSGCADMSKTPPEAPMAETSAFPAGMKELRPVVVENCRNGRFGEWIIVQPDGAEAFNTTGLNDLPEDLWQAQDVDELKATYQSPLVILNGPKFWMMDSQVLMFGGVVTFGGVDAYWAATLPPAGLEEGGGKPYEIFNPNKVQKMVYDAGKPVYELVDPDGHAYVLQARSGQFSMEDLESLGERFQQLPEGWSYRTRVLDEDLVLDLNPERATIYAVGDEFHQYYTRPPEND